MFLATTLCLHLRDFHLTRTFSTGKLKCKYEENYIIVYGLFFITYDLKTIFQEVKTSMWQNLYFYRAEL